MRVPGRPLAGFSAFWKSQRGTERGFFAVTGSFVFLCSGAQSSRSPQEAWAVSPSASQGWGGLGAGTERACDGLGPEPGPPQALGGLSGISCARTRGRKDLPWLGRLVLPYMPPWTSPTALPAQLLCPVTARSGPLGPLGGSWEVGVQAAPAPSVWDLTLVQSSPMELSMLMDGPISQQCMPEPWPHVAVERLKCGCCDREPRCFILHHFNLFTIKLQQPHEPNGQWAVWPWGILGPAQARHPHLPGCLHTEPARAHLSLAFQAWHPSSPRPQEPREPSPWADRERKAQGRRVGWPEPLSRGRNGTPGRWARIAPVLQKVGKPDGAWGAWLRGAQPWPQTFPWLAWLGPHEAQGVPPGSSGEAGGWEHGFCRHTGPGSPPGPPTHAG